VKRFVFRLERFERLRDARRREARARLVSALGQAHERERERIDRERALAESLTLALPDDLVSDPAVLVRLSEWRDGRRRELDHASRLEREAQEVARREAEAHTEAAREHRVLERLRERRFRRWCLERDGEERKFLDEVHQLRVVRERTRDEE
jgi:hypothetical protein